MSRYLSSRRVTCCVPFCRCTKGDLATDPLPADLTGYEIICAKHWRHVPRSRKARRRQLDRRVERIERMWARAVNRCLPDAAGIRWERAYRRAWYAARDGWRMVKAAAIEAAAGM